MPQQKLVQCLRHPKACTAMAPGGGSGTGAHRDLLLASLFKNAALALAWLALPSSDLSVVKAGSYLLTWRYWGNQSDATLYQ